MLLCSFTLLWLLRLVTASLDTCALTCISLAKHGLDGDCLGVESGDNCYCTSPLLAAITALCINQHCSSQDENQLYQYAANSECSSDKLGDLGYDIALDRAHAQVASYAFVNFPNRTVAPYAIPDHVFLPYYRTVDTFHHQLSLGQFHG